MLKKQCKSSKKFKKESYEMSKSIFWKRLEVLAPRNACKVKSEYKLMHGEAVVVTGIRLHRTADWIARCVNRCIEFDCTPEELFPRSPVPSVRECGCPLVGAPTCSQHAKESK